MSRIPENATPCGICGAGCWTDVYRGPIRDGSFGNTVPDARVERCNACGLATLRDAPALDYEDDHYRDLTDGLASVDRYRELHDAEQDFFLALVGPGRLRGRIICDVGCGGGSFLDLARGMAAETVAIEPAAVFRPELERNGHRVYSSAEEAVKREAGRVQLAVCFSVIEHVPDPVGLLRDIRSLLAPGGEAIVGTPNADDWLLELLPDDYGSFFYRSVHHWYFDRGSLCRAAEEAGFTRIEPSFAHRFDLSNLLLWLRDRRPTGHGAVAVPGVVDAAFRESLRRSGRSDYLLVRLAG